MMKEALDQLARHPGVRFAAFVTHDGVPVAVPGCEAEDELAVEPEPAPEPESEPEPYEPYRLGAALDTKAPSKLQEPEDEPQPKKVDPMRQAEYVAALSTGWMAEVARAVAPLSWEPPFRVVLRAARGTLVMRRTHGAWLLALLSAGLRAEDVCLVMDGTAARIERIVRGMGRNTPAAAPLETPAPPISGEPGGLKLSGEMAATTNKIGEHRDPNGS